MPEVGGSPSFTIAKPRPNVLCFQKPRIGCADVHHPSTLGRALLPPPGGIGRRQGHARGGGELPCGSAARQGGGRAGRLQGITGQYRSAPPGRNPVGQKAPPPPDPPLAPARRPGSGRGFRLWTALGPESRVGGPNPLRTHGAKLHKKWTDGPK
jgi:hypothetical protein